MSASRPSMTFSTSLSNGAATMRCGRYCFRTLRAGCSTPASAPAGIARSIRRRRLCSGIDTSPAMLARARRRCPTLSAGGRLYRMDVTALEFPAGSFDAAVAAFLFCVLPRPAGPSAAGAWSRGQAGRRYSAPRICPTTRHPTADRVAAVGSLDRLGLWRKFDRQTERHVPAAGLEIVESRYVVR